MTRQEAIEYLEKIFNSVDFCYLCQSATQECSENCKMKDAINYLKRPLGDRLIEVLKEVRSE